MAAARKRWVQKRTDWIADKNKRLHTKSLKMWGLAVFRVN
jgi:hypothetical protein